MNRVQSILPPLTTVIVYFLVVQSCKKILKRIDRISVVEALVYGVAHKKSKKSKVKVMPIKNYKGKHINFHLAVRECLVERKSWGLIVAIFLLATCIMTIPVNLLNTIESPQFAASMGNSECDLGIDLQFRESIEERSAQIAEALNKDSEVQTYGQFAAVRYEISGEEGYEPFLIGCGDYTNFPIVCLEGRSPMQSGEIAVSYLNAKKFGVKVGDLLTVKQGDEIFNLKVCGIYQDVTGGGYTAKANLKDTEKEVQRYSFFIRLKDADKVEQLADRYAQTFSFAKVMPMERYIKQTYGSVTESFKGSVIITSFLGVFIACLIKVLFLKLQTVKDYSKCATLKAIGFSSKEICKQYMIKVFVCAYLGIVLGIIAANTLGEMGAGWIFSLAGMGLTRFNFTVNMSFTWGYALAL